MLDGLDRSDGWVEVNKNSRCYTVMHCFFAPLCTSKKFSMPFFSASFSLSKSGSGFPPKIPRPSKSEHGSMDGRVPSSSVSEMLKAS